MTYSEEELARFVRMNALPRRSAWAPQSLRAALWAWRALRHTRRELTARGLGATVRPAPPAVPWGNRTGALAVLDRVEPTCLERALVLQTLLAAHGVHLDVVIGVKDGEDGVRAHAWVAGATEDAQARQYTEIHRLPWTGSAG